MRLTMWFMNVLALLLTRTDGLNNDDDRNERVLGKGKKVVGAASFLRMDIKRHTIEEQNCAACEAVAQGIERQMSLDHHKSGRRQAIELLVNACDNIDGRSRLQELDAMPSDDERLRDGGGIGDGRGKVLTLHTFRPDELKLIEQRMDLRAELIGPSVGLDEYCSALIEDFEDVLVETMVTATPLDDSQVNPLYPLESLARKHYELTQQVCVDVTKSCSLNELYAIFGARQYDREQTEAQSMGAKTKAKGKGKGKGKNTSKNKSKGKGKNKGKDEV